MKPLHCLTTQTAPDVGAPDRTAHASPGLRAAMGRGMRRLNRMSCTPDLRPLSACLAAAGLVALAPPVAAQAQAPAPDTAASASPRADRDAPPQTVVVTAQKRAQRLQEVPLAVTAVSGDQLESQGIRDIGDLAKAAASLEFGDQKAGGAGGSASIRGIGTAVFTTSAESSVGLVVDGVALGNTAGGGLFDLEMVEVLRGPQGTLFGKSASAGVLNMRTKAPVLRQLQGFANLELAGGEASNRVVRAGANLPLGQTAALRITARGERMAGVYRNVLTGQDSVNDAEGVRARLLWRPSADLSVNLIAEHDTARGKHAVFFAPKVANASNTAGNIRPYDGFLACGVVVSPDNNAVCSDGPEATRIQVRGLSAQVDWALPAGLSLTSITALRERDNGPNAQSIDMGNFFSKVRATDGLTSQRQFTQELRLASAGQGAFEWTAGLFYSDYDADKTNTTTIVPNPAMPSPPVPRAIATLAVTETRLNSLALFGQASFKLSDRLGLLAGLRLTRDKVFDTETQTGTVRFATFTAPATVKTASNQVEKDNVSGKLGLTYAFDRHTNAYATLTRGYKAPQIDNSTVIGAMAASGTGSGKLVGAEVPTNVELGLKTAFMDRRVQMELALFHTDIENFQEQACALSPIGALACVPLNVPKVKSHGAELELRARLLPGLTVNAAAAAILGTAYPAGFRFDGVDVGGQRLLFSPKGKLVLGADYSRSIWGGWEWTLAGDLTYKTRVRYCNTLADDCGFDAHAIVGLRTGLRSPDDRWGVGLFVRNATDERVPNAVLYPLPGKGAGSGFAHALGGNSFRSVGITADLKF